MTYNEETREMKADDGKVLVISEGVYVKSLFLAAHLMPENIQEINESEMIIYNSEENEDTTIPQ